MISASLKSLEPTASLLSSKLNSQEKETVSHDALLGSLALAIFSATAGKRLSYTKPPTARLKGVLESFTVSAEMDWEPAPIA